MTRDTDSEADKLKISGMEANYNDGTGYIGLKPKTAHTLIVDDTQPTPCCENCIYFKEVFKSGLCRRQPPRLAVFLESGTTYNERRAVWPEVNCEDWCGEHRPMKDKASASVKVPLKLPCPVCGEHHKGAYTYKGVRFYVCPNMNQESHDKIDK